VISLSGLTTSFTLTGPAGTRAEQTGAVTMTVTTNSPDGYQVTVQPATQDLTAPDTADVIPMSDLTVRQTGEAAFQSLAVPVLIHDQSGPSAPDGDLISTDFAIDMPFVQVATYTGTVDYIAMTNP
jgi:NADPH-dependent ferric siderophore reductase